MAAGISITAFTLAGMSTERRSSSPWRLHIAADPSRWRLEGEAGARIGPETYGAIRNSENPGASEVMPPMRTVHTVEPGAQREVVERVHGGIDQVPGLIPRGPVLPDRRHPSHDLIRQGRCLQAEQRAEDEIRASTVDEHRIDPSDAQEAGGDVTTSLDVCHEIGAGLSSILRTQQVERERETREPSAWRP